MAVILGIETSCDETACAVVNDGKRILSDVVSSQMSTHRKYCGVVPELASREHIIAINGVIEEALHRAGIGRSLIREKIDAIAYTRGPGLAGALLVGQIAAQTLSFLNNLPLIDVNHLEGHLYAATLAHPRLAPPYLCLIVSGGHTELVIVREYGDYRFLGGTRDDAAGEAFDKVAKLLKLGYPGGPVIDVRAQKGDPRAINFPRPYLRGSWDFSFSGLKTAVVNYCKRSEIDGNKCSVNDICASFQAAVVSTLVEKTFAAAREFDIPMVVAGGGVASNSALRLELQRRARKEKRQLALPPPALCTDNGAMIAQAGFFKFRACGTNCGSEAWKKIEPGLQLTNW